MNKFKNALCVVAIGLTALSQLLSPLTVYADGETTPPPTETPASIITESATPAPMAVEASRTPTDSMLVNAPATETPTVDPLLTPTDTASPTPTDIPAEATFSEILSQAPDNTNVVVLDANGQAVSLATQDAAEIIAMSDPFWCPASVTTPQPEVNGCSSSYSSLANLLADLSAMNEGTGIDEDITIWIESSYDKAINDPTMTGIALDGAVLTTWAEHSLTLQGGWMPESSSLGPNSNVWLNFYILHWNNDIAINNINGGNVIISTSGDVTFSNSDFTNSTGVIITDVAFNGQPNNSITALPNEPVTVSFNYAVWNPTPYCPGCITQLVPGLDVTPAGYCAYNGVPGSYNNGNPITQGSDTHTYTGLTPEQIYYLTVTHHWEYICTNAIENYEGKPPAPPRVITTIASQGQASFKLNCLNQDGFAVSLPNGDLVNIFCPVSGNASIHRIDHTTLPADLPVGFTYASAFSLDILEGSSLLPVITEGGRIQASFIAQPLQPGNTYSVLYWDEWKLNEQGKLVKDPNGGRWVPLKDFLLNERGNTVSFDLFPPRTEGDMRRIISGVKPVTRNGVSRVEVSTNFPGIFVLVQR